MIDIKQLAAKFAEAAKGGGIRRVHYCSGCARRGKSVEVEPTIVQKDGQRTTYYAWGCSECVGEAERSRDRLLENAQRETYQAAGATRGLRRHPGTMR